MNKINTYIVDSFTNEPFKGNPAGVCLLDSPLKPDQMLTIAQELGLSETAFVQKINNLYAIRYFSPKMEIPLCGHATLASAKIIFTHNFNLESIRFNTIEDINLDIKKMGELIEMTFPIYETQPSSAPEELLKALGLQRINNSVYNNETRILLLEIDSSDILASLTPDFEALRKSHDSINGVLVTAPSRKENFDFESRYFWPWSGTNEDPVTGGTHTFLTKYWSTRLNKKKMNSFQCSKRSGFMTVELINDHQMTITSDAQVVFEGTLFI